MEKLAEEGFLMIKIEKKRCGVLKNKSHISSLPGCDFIVLYIPYSSQHPCSKIMDLIPMGNCRSEEITHQFCFLTNHRLHLAVGESGRLDPLHYFWLLSVNHTN
jgi:hypothetical protein